MASESTQLTSQNTISRFPILPLSNFQNERFTEPLNTRVQATLYSHIQDNLSFFGVANIQDLVRLLLADFMAGEIVPRSNGQSNEVESIELRKKNAELESEVRNLTHEIDFIKAALILTNKECQSYKDKYETSQKQSDSALNPNESRFESNLNQTDSALNQNESRFESNLNQTDSALNPNESRFESSQNQTDSALNQVESRFESNLNQTDSALNQLNQVRIKDSEIKRLNEEISDNHDYITKLKYRFEESIKAAVSKAQQLPEGFKLFSPKEQSDLEHNYLTAINNAKQLGEENELLNQQIREIATFDDSHTAAALSKMAKDIAQASRMPFHTFTDEAIINLFLKYYQIESKNAKVSSAPQ